MSCELTGFFSQMKKLLRGERLAQLKKKQWYGKVLWSLLFVVIAVASISVIVTQSRGFTWQGFVEYLSEASPVYVIAAVLCMLGFIWFEGVSLVFIARNFGYKSHLLDGLAYSSSDIYLSSITPSATGGQPASAYFMMQSGIPGTVATVSLLLNLMMYLIAMVVVGVLSFILRPELFLSFSLLSKILIVLGASVQLGLVFLFWLLLRKEKILFGVCHKLLNFLEWLKILKKREKMEQRLESSMVRYRECAKMIAGKRRMVIGAFVFNLLQRLSLIMVTIFAYLGTGGSISQALDIGATQCYVYLGSNVIPMPGAIGVSDYILLDGLGNLVEDYAHLGIFSRALSFYFCVLLCGIIMLVSYVGYRVAHKRKESSMK